MMLPSKLVEQINMRIASIALAIILILIPSLPALAQDSDSETITITMTTKMVIEIELNPTTWDIGTIRPEEEKNTGNEYFTMTNKSNCEVNTYIKGEDAVWVEDPDAYTWTLSNSWSNGTRIYVLWYERLSDAPTKDLITTEEKIFYPNFGMDGANPKKFGLKLEAPLADYNGYFYGGGEMETTVTISGVVA